MRVAIFQELSTMDARDLYKRLSFLNAMPSGDASKAWLSSAEHDARSLLTEVETDRIILYASFRNLWILSIFVPARNLASANRSELSNAWIRSDDAWCIQRAWGGGEGHRIYLEPPLHFDERHPLAGSEPIVFRRSFDGMRNYFPPIEIDQKLVHSLGLHFMPERNAFCRLNDEGDIEEVIHLFQDKGTGNFDSQAAVLIDSRALSEYLAVGGFALYRKFDITRTSPVGFSGWKARSSSFDSPDIFYEAASDPDASYVHGVQILRPSVTVDELVEEWKQESDPSARSYETFKINDWKNDRLVEWSSAPSELSNYFTKSDKPFETSPAFFSAEVLTKYKANPEKYDLKDRWITCRNSWHLKTYDINEAGQVHTYIGYLQGLPHKEQQHWKLYNEWPKGGLSKRAIETDFEGTWASELDPLQELRHSVETLDRELPAWWSLRGPEVRDRVHYPVTTSSKEWSDELIALDQMLVEGFVAKELRRIADGAGAKLEKDWQSLKVIQELLATLGYPDSVGIMAPLRKLHHLRSKVAGHRTEERVTLEAEAFKGHGSLRAHFRALCAQCNDSFSTIVTVLTPSS